MNSNSNENNGIDANNTIFGTAGDDRLDGGKGNYKLIGYTGNDTYIFAKGYGEAVIDNWGSASTDIDILILKDIKFNEVSLLAIDNDLIIKVKETSDKVTVQGYFKNGEYSLEEIRFADAEEMDYKDILYYVYEIGTEIIGTSGDDIIDSNNIKYGKSVLNGLGGNDKLIGSIGDDIYIFAKGYGRDEIDNKASVGWDKDILLLKDIKFDEVEIQEDKLDLIIKVKGTDDTVIVKHYFKDKDNSLEEIKFADGKVMQYKDFIEYLK